MPKRAIVILLAVILAAGSSVFAGFITQDVVDQVSQASYSNYLDNMLYTHLGDDRGFGSEHDLAQSNIYSEFDSFGLTSSLHSFSYSGDTYYM